MAIKNQPEREYSPYWMRAFVYKDHLGRGWYAYAPTMDDDLDAEGHIPAMCFETRDEAEEAVWAAIRIAAERPNHSTVGMQSYVNR